jgi:hypothetical protein
MVAKKVEAYKKRLQAKEQELVSSIAKIETDGRDSCAPETQDLADKANGSFTKESLFQQSDYDRAILSLVQAAAGRRGRVRCLRRMRATGRAEAVGRRAVGATLHPLSKIAGQGAAMRMQRNPEVGLLE